MPSKKTKEEKFQEKLALLRATPDPDPEPEQNPDLKEGKIKPKEDWDEYLLSRRDEWRWASEKIEEIFQDYIEKYCGFRPQEIKRPSGLENWVAYEFPCECREFCEERKEGDDESLPFKKRSFFQKAGRKVEIVGWFIYVSFEEETNYSVVLTTWGEELADRAYWRSTRNDYNMGSSRWNG
jgi:hypothetical protein